MKLRRWFCVGMLGFFSALSMPVRADVAPIPERPVDWDEHPSPMPQEPPDDALARRLVPLEVVRTLGAYDFAPSKFWYSMYSDVMPRVLNFMRSRGKEKTKQGLSA